MRLLLIIAVAIAAFLPAHASAKSIDFNDLRKIVSLSSPQISPDGKRVVFVRSRADYEKDKNVSQLMLVDVATKQTRELTYERTGVSSPLWSPDGKSIAFLADAKHDEKSDEQSQIFVLSLAGGDARKVSDAANGVDNFAWSPDGKRFAYVTQDDNPHQKQIDQHLDAFEVGSNDYLHKSQSMPSHLWVIDASGGKARRLTSGTWSLGTVDPYGTSDLSWSPDSKKIAFVRFPTPLVGDSMGTVIDIVDVRSGKLVSLNRNSNLENSPEFSPAGTAISYTRNTDGDAGNGVSVYVKQLGTGDAPARANVDRNIDGKTWAANGKALWLFGRDGLRTAAWYVPLNGTAKNVAFGEVAISQTSNVARTGAMALIGATTSHPNEVYYLASPSSRPVRLTNLNGEIAKLDLGRVVPVTWRNDGYSEDGVLTLPPHYDPHKSYPLVLVIHGGPQSASTMGWSSQNQLFASHGYMVFNPNYRGSTNLGDRYQRAIVRDAGDGPGRDVMAGIAAVERRYKVDKNRIGVSGWSYGGYMTSWMIGHYNIWKTAVSGAALNDWFDDYNDAFYVYTDVPFFGGSPWNPKYTAMWRAQSPITYAQNVRTPTLILGDLGDNNVTITNSFKMYHALKDNGVPVEFVAYPVHGHFPRDPVRSEDVTRRWLAWIDRYLR
jgi:dipeptidyl aminopeptidase/acylaminoacyl peptidase